VKYYWCMCGNDEFVSRTVRPFHEVNVCSKCGLVYDFHTMQIFKGLAEKIPMPNLIEEPADGKIKS
jgi:hypothetical protein